MFIYFHQLEKNDEWFLSRSLWHIKWLVWTKSYSFIVSIWSNNGYIEHNLLFLTWTMNDYISGSVSNSCVYLRFDLTLKNQPTHFDGRIRNRWTISKLRASFTYFFLTVMKVTVLIQRETITGQVSSSYYCCVQLSSSLSNEDYMLIKMFRIVSVGD